MPQLDKVSFLSQFFWLSVFFWGFYITALKYFLPFMSRILKYRKKRLHGGTELYNTTPQPVDHKAHNSTEINKVRRSGDQLLEIGLKHSKRSFKQNLQKTEKYLLENIHNTNEKELKDTNFMYLHSLAERVLSHKLCMQKSFLDFSSAIFFSVLKDKIRYMTRSTTSTI